MSRADARVVRLQVAHLVDARSEATALPRLWSARALADRLNVSRGYIFRLHSKGFLVGYRLKSTGGTAGPLRFAESDVLALLSEERGE